MVITPIKQSSFTEDEQEFLDSVFFLHSSNNSKKIILSILRIFTKYTRKSLFDTSRKDCYRFFTHIAEQVEKGNMKKGYAHNIYYTIKRFFRLAYAHGKVSADLFDSLPPPFKNDEKIAPASVPTLSDVEHLFSLLEPNSDARIAALLCFHMALFPSELAGIKKEQFVTSGHQVYLRMMRKNKIKGGSVEEEVFLLVPSDAWSEIHKFILKNPTSTYLFCKNRFNEAISTRTLIRRLQTAQKGQKKNLTYSSLRTLAILRMGLLAADTKDVANYAGVSEEWVLQHVAIPKDRHLDASKFV